MGSDVATEADIRPEVSDAETFTESDAYVSVGCQTGETSENSCLLELRPGGLSYADISFFVRQNPNWSLGELINHLALWCCKPNLDGEALAELTKLVTMSVFSQRDVCHDLFQRVTTVKEIEDPRLQFRSEFHYIKAQMERFVPAQLLVPPKVWWNLPQKEKQPSTPNKRTIRTLILPFCTDPSVKFFLFKYVVFLTLRSFPGLSVDLLQTAFFSASTPKSVKY